MPYHTISYIIISYLIFCDSFCRICGITVTTDARVYCHMNFFWTVFQTVSIYSINVNFLNHFQLNFTIRILDHMTQNFICPEFFEHELKEATHRSLVETSNILSNPGVALLEEAHRVCSSVVISTAFNLTVT